jgi:hypothetical protein
MKFYLPLSKLLRIYLKKREFLYLLQQIGLLNVILYSTIDILRMGPTPLKSIQLSYSTEVDTYYFATLSIRLKSDHEPGGAR